MSLRWCFFVGLVLLSFGLTLRAEPAGASVDDAKRKLANQMIADGHLKDAEAILKEIVKNDANQYRDHMALAQVYEKGQRGEEAAAEYRTVVGLLPEHPTDRDAAKARILADKRLRVLDAETGKIGDAVDDFMKKLDGFEKEAAQTRNISALAKIGRIRGALWSAEARPGHDVFQIFAAKQWQDTGIDLVAGHHYRILATGVWKIGNDPCAPDGLPGQKTARGPVGALVGLLGPDPAVIGSKLEFTAAKNGRLLFLCNIGTGDADGRTEASGYVTVIIQQ